MGNYCEFDLVFEKKAFTKVLKELNVKSEIMLRNDLYSEEKFQQNSNLEELISKLNNNSKFLNFSVGSEFVLDDKIFLYHLSEFIEELLNNQKLSENYYEIFYPIFSKLLKMNEATFEELFEVYCLINKNLFNCLKTISNENKEYFRKYWEDITHYLKIRKAIIFFDGFLTVYQNYINLSLIGWGANERNLFQESFAIRNGFSKLLKLNSGLIGYFTTELSSFYQLFYLNGNDLDMENSSNWILEELLDKKDNFEKFILEIEQNPSKVNNYKN